jgi:hypothetical protein
MLLPRYLAILTTSSSGRESKGELGNAAAIFFNYLILKNHKLKTSHCKLCLCFTSEKAQHFRLQNFISHQHKTVFSAVSFNHHLSDNAILDLEPDAQQRT